MKNLYLIAIIVLLNCSTNIYDSEKEKEKKEKENQIQWLLASVLISSQTFVPNRIDLEAYLNSFKTAMTINIICNDYLNKKDGVD